MGIRQWSLVACACLIAAGASAQTPEPLRVKVFPGAQNLALWTGLARGTFAQARHRARPAVHADLARAP